MIGSQEDYEEECFNEISADSIRDLISKKPLIKVMIAAYPNSTRKKKKKRTHIRQCQVSGYLGSLGRSKLITNIGLPPAIVKPIIKKILIEFDIEKDTLKIILKSTEGKDRPIKTIAANIEKMHTNQHSSGSGIELLCNILNNHKMCRILIELFKEKKSASNLAKEIEIPQERVRKYIKKLQDLNFVVGAGNNLGKGNKYEQLWITRTNRILLEFDIKKGLINAKAELRELEITDPRNKTETSAIIGTYEKTEKSFIWKPRWTIAKQIKEGTISS